MTFQGVKTGILSQLKTIASSLDGYDIIWPNAPLASTTTQVVNYAVIDVMWGGTERVDLGTAGTNVRQRTVGVVQIALHVPAGGGESNILRDADQVAELVRHQSSTNGVVFRTPSVASRGRVNDGRHWRVDVEVPFRADFIS